MTADPVDVLARDLCCLGPCDSPEHCSRVHWMKAAQAHIRALDAAGFKLIAQPSSAQSTVSTYMKPKRTTNKLGKLGWLKRELAAATREANKLPGWLMKRKAAKPKLAPSRGSFKEDRR